MFLHANHPLDFHARVMDQNNLTVAGAKIEFRIVRVDEQRVASQEFLHMKEGSEQVTETKVLSSDENGWIHFTGVSGKRLTALSLSKDGYISNYPNPAYVGVSYDYSGERQPVGDILATNGWNPNAGYYFHLWKKGATEKLVRVNCSVPVEAYGTNWYAANLITGRANDFQDSDIVFWFQTITDGGGNPARQFRYKINNGGLMLDADPYPYQAPETGYATEWDWYYEPFGKDANADKSALTGC